MKTKLILSSVAGLFFLGEFAFAGQLQNGTIDGLHKGRLINCKRELKNENLTNFDNFPVGPCRKKYGYLPRLVALCPGTKSKYKEIKSSLDKLAEKIESEACKNSPIKAEVRDLKDLIDKQKSFNEMVKKGLSGEEVKSSEVDSLRSHISDVSLKVADVVGLLENDACFSQKKQKKNVLSLLSSVVSNTASLAGNIAGPFGAKIALGGAAISGVLDTIDKIRQARETYDFENSDEDEENYVNNLCSYLEIKDEIEEFTRHKTVLADLRKLHKSTDRLLSRFANECEPCREIIEKFENQAENNVDNNTGVSKFSVAAVTGGASGEVTELVNAVEKDLNKTSFGEMHQAFKKEIEDSAADYKKTKSGLSMGYLTLRSLRTRQWVEDEHERIQIEPDLWDVSRETLQEQQNLMEEFLAPKIGRKFINYRAEKTRALQSQFESLLAKHERAFYGLYNTFLNPDPNRPQRNPERWRENFIDSIFGADLDFTKVFAISEKPR